MNGLPQRLKWIPMLIKAFDEARMRTNGQGPSEPVPQDWLPAERPPQRRKAASASRRSSPPGASAVRRPKAAKRAGRRTFSEARSTSPDTAYECVVQRLHQTEAALRELQSAQQRLERYHAVLMRQLDEISRRLAAPGSAGAPSSTSLRIEDTESAHTGGEGGLP